MITTTGLTRIYGKGENAVTAINNLDIRINDGELVAITGKSGSGKTTLLNILGGLDKATGGSVCYDDTDITKLADTALADFRLNKIGFVFQFYDLIPELTAKENILLPSKLAKKGTTDISDTVKKLGVENLLGRYPSELSGGQQQRVAIARALVNHPKVLLLDEPLGALDLKLRKEMQTELRKIQQALELTFIYVTHDQEEALTMSDTVVVMNNGNIQQIGSPTDIYNEPVNAFVADFIGESNILNGIMPEDCVAEFSGHRFECVDKGFAKNEKVDVVIRPEDIKIVPPANAKLTGIVKSVVFKGVHYEMTVDGMEHKWIIHSTLHEPVGTMIGMDIAPFDIHIMKKSEE